MKITEQQLTFLTSLVSKVIEHDTLGCDDCFALLDRFGDAVLAGDPLPPQLEAVRTHLQQCRCCRIEYEALLAALREIAQA